MPVSENFKSPAKVLRFVHENKKLLGWFKKSYGRKLLLKGILGIIIFAMIMPGSILVPLLLILSYIFRAD